MTVKVKVKFADFHQLTRSGSFPMVIARHGLLRQASVGLVRATLGLVITEAIVLKRGLTPLSGELGIRVCGGRGNHSRQTPSLAN